MRHAFARRNGPRSCNRKASRPGRPNITRETLSAIQSLRPQEGNRVSQAQVGVNLLYVTYTILHRMTELLPCSACAAVVLSGTLGALELRLRGLVYKS